MATKQISLITMKTGYKVNLPDSLAEGEICFTRDTGEVFIGAPNFGPIQYRSDSSQYSNGQGVSPFRNIRFLTELDVAKTITGDYFIQGPLIQKTLPMTSQYDLNKFDPAINTSIIQFSLYDGQNVKGVGTLYCAVDSGKVNINAVGIIPAGVVFTGRLEGNQIVLSASNNTSTEYNVWLCCQNWVSY